MSRLFAKQAVYLARKFAVAVLFFTKYSHCLQENIYLCNWNKYLLFRDLDEC